jgi:hypothetical protein
MQKYTFEWASKELLEISKELKRMPSANELMKGGRNDLSNYVARHGGFRQWANVMGIPQKPSETKMAQDWEFSEMQRLEQSGYKVIKQATRAEFDLLVNGRRVDVKAASLYSCSSWSGYVWAGIKYGKTADFFDLLCVDGNKLLRRYWVPAKKMNRQTLTLTIGGFNSGQHWLEKYRDD